jgi:predicted peptidase
MKEKSFKTFLKEEENKHPFISSLEDELGIPPDELDTEPQVASFFSFDKNINNLGTYKIINFKTNEKGEKTHAIVKQINDKKIKNRQYQDKNGNLIRVEKPSEDKTFIVPIKDLDKLMSQDFVPNQGATP